MRRLALFAAPAAILAAAAFAAVAHRPPPAVAPVRAVDRSAPERPVAAPSARERAALLGLLLLLELRDAES